MYPVYNGGTTNTGYYDEYNMDGSYILVSARGANAGFANRIKGRYWAGNSCYSIQVTDCSVNSDYIYYSIKNMQNKLIGSQQRAGIPAVSKKQMEGLEIPIPSLHEQNRIVAILDMFDTLLTDISSGIPAEVKARHKQYEHYRNRLLSFGKLETETSNA